MRVEQATLTAHMYSLPSPVGCSVMSVSHSWLIQVALKSRSTRSSWTAGPARRDRPLLRACSDQMPCWEHSRHTRFSPAVTPPALSSSAMNR
jgi:hypothetical protein